jgi:hypothetical protein
VIRSEAAIAGAAAALVAGGFLSELRIGRDQEASDRWRRVPTSPRGATLLGISFRPLQAEAMGLDPASALGRLLAHPFPLVRLAALWSRLEPRPGILRMDELDRQVEAATRAGKLIILGVGAVRNFGHPEVFVPRHHLLRPLEQSRLVRPESHPELFRAALEFVTSIVERYRDCSAVIAWQVENEAGEALHLRHPWRLSAGFISGEVDAVRAADGTGRRVVLTGLLPTTLAVALPQRWLTRDQGASLSLASRFADIIGIDVYTRHALRGFDGSSLYLDGMRSRWLRSRHTRLLAAAAERRQRVMVTEGQAEPWEVATNPPAAAGRYPYSCPPERIIVTYNCCQEWAHRAGVALEGYLFWGAEYWLRRADGGDPAYLHAFRRVLEAA